MVKKIILNIAAVIFLTVIIQAQDIKAVADTDAAEYLVGDFINYTLTVTHTDQIIVDTPKLPDSLKEISFVASSKPEKKEENGKIIETFKYVFSKYDSAEVTIPPQSVPYRYKGSDKVYFESSNPISFLVKTVPVDETAEIRDIKQPLTISPNWIILLLVIWLILFMLGIYFMFKFFWVDKKKKIEVQKKIEIQVPPHQEALTKLRWLEMQKMWQAGQVKEYHSEITGIIRKYFEKRFNIMALEMTTAEIMSKLRKHRDAIDNYDLINEFFTNADMVKFAKFVPLATVNKEMMTQAYRIVNETKYRTVVQPGGKETVNV